MLSSRDRILNRTIQTLNKTTPRISGYQDNGRVIYTKLDEISRGRWGSADEA